MKIITSDLLNGCKCNRVRARNDFHDNILKLSANVSEDKVTFSFLVKSYESLDFDGWLHNERKIIGTCNVNDSIERESLLYDKEGCYTLKLSLSDNGEKINIEVKQDYFTWINRSGEHELGLYHKVPYTPVIDSFAERREDFFIQPKAPEVEWSSYLTQTQYELLTHIIPPLENATNRKHVKYLLCSNKPSKDAFKLGVDTLSQIEISRSVYEFRLLKERMEDINYFYYVRMEGDKREPINVVLATIGWCVGDKEQRLVMSMITHGETLGTKRVAEMNRMSIKEAEAIMKHYRKHCNTLKEIRPFFTRKAMN